MDVINDANITSLVNNMTHKDITKRFYPSNCIHYLNGELDDIDAVDNDLCNIFGCCKK